MILLLLPVSCDDGADKPPAGKDGAVATKDPAKSKTIVEVEAKADDKAKDEADAEAELTEEDKERAERLAKRFEELETWKTEEAARWTDTLHEQNRKLLANKYKTPKAAIKAILASGHRLPKNVERDKYRHPAETLAFFDIKPNMTVVEIGPGEGWYTEILAPLLANEGKLVVTQYDPAGPETEGRTLYGRRLQAFLERSDELYGKVEPVVQTDPAKPALGADASADMVFVVRELHGRVTRDEMGPYLEAINAVLKPGGTLAIVQHRAADDADPKTSAEKGYLPEPWVIAQMEAAGFELDKKSEINANPKDTKDYEDGVWTLPPGLAKGDTDKDKYLAIGESDRMTLRFRKKS
jgi:predicted methyltransferase